jgi:hypothetical protein
VTRAAKPLLAAIVVLYGASFLWGLGLDHDEGEHIHSAWLMAQGLLPFTDFFQTHSPLLWVVTAPILAILPPGGAVVPVFRFLAVLLLAASIFLVVRISRRLNGRHASDLLTAFLCLGAAASTQLFVFRPDLVSNMLSLAAIGLLASSWRPRTALMAGFLLGLAAGFNPKAGYLLCVLPVAGLIARVGLRRLSVTLAAHLAGVLAGLVPLAAWLVANGLTDAFVEAVFRLNSRLHAGTWLATIGVSYPAVALCVAAVLALAFPRRPLDEDGRRARITLAVAFAGSCAAFLLKPGPMMPYNLQMCALLAAAPATPVVSRLLARMASRWRLAPILAAAVLFVVDGAKAYGGGIHPPHLEFGSTIGTLGRLAGDGSVVTKVPFHPIFNRDATALYFSWQWRWRDHPEIAASLKDMADRIVAARPSLVLAVWGDVVPGTEVSLKTTLPMDLVESRILPREEGLRLAAFLKDNYRLVGISGMPFWVRADIEIDPSMPRLDLVD